MKKTLLALVLILPLAACGGGEQANLAEKEAAAPDETATETELSYLGDFVGKYPADVELWTIEPMASRLQALLGDQYDAFIENMTVVGPIAQEEGLIYVMGSKEDQGGGNSAVLVADVANDNLKVWLLQEGNPREFVEKDMFVSLPSEAVAFISGWHEGS